MKALYRIVNAVLGALFFPAALFLDVFFIQISTTLANAGVEESINIKRIISIITGNDPLSRIVLKDGSFKWPEAFAPINGKLIAAAVFFCLVLAAALFIVIWSCCSNKRLPIFIAGIAALVFTIVMIIIFNSAAASIISGEIGLVKALAGEGVLSTLFGGLVQVDNLKLGGFHCGFIILAIVILVWTGAFYLVELGDTEEEAKKHRSAK